MRKLKAGYDEFGWINDGKVIKKEDTMSNKNFKTGNKVRVTGNTSSHGSPIGTTLTIKAQSGAYWTVLENSWNYFPNDLEMAVISRDDLVKSIEDAEDTVANLKLKLQYLDSIGSKEFCETEFKVYSSLQVLEDSKSTMLDKARVIAKLING